MNEIVLVTDVEILGQSSVRVIFSNGMAGVRDFSDVLAEGRAMVEALRDPVMFSRVFVRLGVPTWPNGFAVDAVRLHDEMKAAGALKCEPASVHSVRDVAALSGFRLRIEFLDGAIGVYDFSPHLTKFSGPMIEPLRDQSYFARVTVDSGAPTWPNGFDLCPDWLRREMEAAGSAWRRRQNRQLVTTPEAANAYAALRRESFDTRAKKWPDFASFPAGKGLPRRQCLPERASPLRRACLVAAAREPTAV
jgi:Protein of unknown function (DUF2442)